MSANSAHSADSYVSPVRALVVASHPGPVLVITALVTALTAHAAPSGTGPVLAAPAVLAGQLSVGWSNDACDAARDLAAGRTDKPIARGDISVRAVWIAAFSALAVAAILSLLIGPRWLLINAVLVGAAWAYNLGLKFDLGIRLDVRPGIRASPGACDKHDARPALANLAGDGRCRMPGARHALRERAAGPGGRPGHGR